MTAGNIDRAQYDGAASDSPQQTLIAQEPPSSGEDASSLDVRQLLEGIGSFATPDATVVTTDWMNRPGARNFALLNPIAGTYTQFISHGTQTADLFGVPVKRVEAIHYNANGGETRREDGLGWAKKLGDITPFFNVRAGDTNLISSDNGASANIGFFGAPGAMKGVWDKLENSGDPKMRAVAKGLSGLEVGVAYRGTLLYNKKTEELELKVSGVTIPLPDLAKAMESVPKTNQGKAEIARSNNREDYLQGANPFSLADYTRDPSDKGLRNHGDPTSAIAGNIVELGEAVNPGLPRVRTNAQAKQVLEEAIERNFAPLTADQRRLFGQDAETLHPDPLNAQQRDQLNGVLANLERYGMDFDSEKIREAFSDVPLNQTGDGKPPMDRQFVRDVYEGDFRHEFADSNNPALDIAVGLNRHIAIASSLLGGSPTAQDEVILQQIGARNDGLEARLEAQSGSVLGALGIEANDLSGAEREQFEDKLTAGLVGVLQHRLAEADTAVTSQNLYDEFARLSPSELNAVAARLNAASR